MPSVRKSKSPHYDCPFDLPSMTLGESHNKWYHYYCSNFMSLTIDDADQKSLETVFLIAICRHSGDKWQSKTLFLTVFDLRSSIVLTVSIAAYPV